MCNEAFSKDPLMLKHRLDRFKTQEICDEAINTYLPTFFYHFLFFIGFLLIK